MGGRGFTLIEVVLIIVVTAIAIPVLIFVLGQQARYTVDAEKQVAAANLGQELMEEIKSKAYSAAAAYDGYSDTVVLGGVRYDRAVAVCDVDASDLETCSGSTTGFTRISVTVASDLGTTEVVTLVTDR